MIVEQLIKFLCSVSLDLWLGQQCMPFLIGNGDWKFQQGNLSFEQYYSGFLNMWSEYSNIVNAKVSKMALQTTKAVHEESKHDQFLMKIGPKFKTTQAGLNKCCLYMPQHDEMNEQKNCYLLNVTQFAS